MSGQLPEVPQIDWDKVLRLMEKIRTVCNEEDSTINEAGLAFHQYTLHQAFEAAMGFHEPTTAGTAEFLNG